MAKIRRDPLDTLFSRYIRTRDKWTCQRCGRYKGEKGKVDAHHFIRRRNKLMKCNPDNSISLCYGCHQYLHEHRSEEEALMIWKFGEEKVNQLKANERITGKPDVAAIELYLKQELKKLEEA